MSAWVRFLRWTLIGMTTTVAAVTVWEAGHGGDVGHIFMGLAISITGVFMTALWGEYDRSEG